MLRRLILITFAKTNVRPLKKQQTNSMRDNSGLCCSAPGRCLSSQTLVRTKPTRSRPKRAPVLGAAAHSNLSAPFSHSPAFPRRLRFAESLLRKNRRLLCRRPPPSSTSSTSSVGFLLLTPLLLLPPPPPLCPLGFFFCFFYGGASNT